jgi:hypothetical protein
MRQIYSLLDGKSAEEIIKYAEQIDKTEYEHNISQITAQILKRLTITSNVITREK